MSSDITISIDNTGKIVISEEFVQALGLKKNDSVTISIDIFKEKIIINKAISSCVFCRTAVDLIQISQKYVCIRCRDSLARATVGDCLY